MDSKTSWLKVIRLIFPLFIEFQLFLACSKNQIFLHSHDNFLVAKASRDNCRRIETLIRLVVFSVTMIDFILHCSFFFAIKDDSRFAFLHVLNASILKWCLARSRLEIFEAIVKEYCAALVICDQLDVVGYVSTNKSFGKMRESQQLKRF